jgi:2-methylcitrate dehydratase PrpD
LKLEDVPQGVVDKAKLVLLDTLGVALASSTMDFGRMVMNVARKLGGVPASRLIGSPLKVAAATPSWPMGHYAWSRL